MSSDQTKVAEITLVTLPGARLDWSLAEALRRSANDKKVVHLVHQGVRYTFDFDAMIATAMDDCVIVDTDAHADAKSNGNS